MTRLYIGLCVLVYALTTIQGGFHVVGLPAGVARRWGALLTGHGAGEQPWGGAGEPWRYLSAVFVHFGALHILVNMLVLYSFGRLVEQAIGSARFAVLFVSAGVLGFLTSDAWYALRGVLTITAGASGGIAGLIGAIIGFAFVRRDPLWKRYLLQVVLYATLLAFSGIPVNNAAHAGGFIGGGLLAVVFFKERRPWKREQLFRVLAAMLVIASFASVLLSRAAPLGAG